MSYASKDQLLEPALDKILEGMEMFLQASYERMRHHDDWNPEHIAELTEYRKAIIALQPQLLKLKSETI